MMMIRPLLAAVFLLAVFQPGRTETTEFCLNGEFDLGARYQGMHPQSGELYPARWCVTTDDESERVLLSMSGHSNPDMDGSWTVAFIPPDLVRIVNTGSPPDIEFRTSRAAADARRTRQLDPRYAADMKATVDMPLRGHIPVTWRWTSPLSASPGLKIEVGGQLVFQGIGLRRIIAADEAVSLWQSTPGAEPVQVPGDRWPSRIAMELIHLTDGVYVVRGVRTGFHHMIVDTGDGLVVADAPTGWIELHQFPPEDLVPGLGISGLSEQLIEFLAQQLPGRPIRAVALTHHHDDHAGGARAFAAVGADVYAPAEVARFLSEALNSDLMPADQLDANGGNVVIWPVVESSTIGDEGRPVELVNMGKSPHAIASLGVLANGYFFQSDLHVPNSDADEPRAERAATECWFAHWAVDNLPPDVRVINTHSTYETPVSRLARYLDSDLCSGAALEP